jgi:hypothetical protein
MCIIQLSRVDNDGTNSTYISEHLLLTTYTTHLLVSIAGLAIIQVGIAEV